eukprot:CAMPEP_0195629454 /NCGR_PEP_ID=MMETSP0815-20121206/20004_1 /TAXON_ID=97485 /ORGANISM="Prymnesium parvum, Strain Texoma1" /LENGTH=191 /DNA_ID=CAMNT_0040770817 /DNA_START=94 /DNA_END=666 /DNA_ORIENTATION=-
MKLQVELVLKLLPDDGEERCLQYVGKQPRAKPAAEEPIQPVGCKHTLCGGGVAQRSLRRLPRGLDHSDRVGEHIRHTRRACGQRRRAQQPQREGGLLGAGQPLIHRIEDEEPRVAADEVGGGVGERAGPQLADPLEPRLPDQQRVRRRALHLQSCLERVERRDQHACIHAAADHAASSASTPELAAVSPKR